MLHPYTAEKVRMLRGSPSERLARCVETGFVMANSTRSAHSRSMKSTEEVRKYAAEQGIAEEKALKRGVEPKSKEFVDKGAEVHAPV